jgi:hypothetical protein
MPIGSGIAGQIGYALEVTAGLAVTPTQFVPLVNEKLEQKRGRVESEGIIAGRRVLDASMWNGGNVEVGGDVGHELYNRGLGKLFTGMFGTVTSTTGPVSLLYTHTWSAVGEPRPLTVQKGVPGVAGVVHPMTYAGMMVEEWEIACKAGEIVTLGVTFAGMTETGHRTVSDGVTTSGSPTVTSATAAFGPDDLFKPISGTGIPALTYVGVVNSATSVGLSSSNTVNTPVNASATGASIVFTIGIPLAAASFPSTPSLSPFKYTHGSITFGGSLLPVKELKLAGKNGLDMDRFFIGSRTRSQPLEADLHELTGQLEIEFTDRAMYNRFISEGTYSLVTRFQNAATESVTFTQTVRVDGDSPRLAGRGIVPQSVPVKCTGATDAAAFSVVVVSADVTP